MPQGFSTPSLRILYRDLSLVAIDKPAGFYVHPPEGGVQRISQRVNCLALLRNQLGQYVYPVHRLDRATAGVLLFALTPERARALAGAFAQGRIRKTYVCVVRGWTEPEGIIERELAAENPDSPPMAARTRYRTLGRIEIPERIDRYDSSRYSLVMIEPETGRLHQIRRHFAGISHPLIGDSVYGHGAHNRYFRDRLQLPGLWLKAATLEVQRSDMGGSDTGGSANLTLRSPWRGNWHRIFERFGICPITC